MTEILQLCGWFAIVFAISVGASYFFVSLKIRGKLAKPVENGVLQIRAGTGLYRTRFVRESSAGWVVNAPLSRDSHVPLRVGEKLIVLMPTADGLRRFETEIILRDVATHEFTLAKPARMTVVERRQSHRIDHFMNPQASIDGRTATLLDLSSGGVRLIAEEPLKRGERAAIDLPSTGRVFGWVLDSSPANPGYVMRLRFEEPVQI
jgi:hypothetical protein